MARPAGSPIERFATPAGLRVICRQIRSAAECCGVAILAGSRDELPDEQGLAHFVEHTIFKGTRRRRSYHVINRMETVGGELNAYTTKEETFVYTLAPSGNLARSVELLSDLLLNSIFPSSELDKEREVIADEIDSYLDSPADAVYDDFEDRIFAGSTLGHNILGSKESISRFDTSACRRWVGRMYLPERMVLFYNGPAPASRVARLAARFFDFAPRAVVDRQALSSSPAAVAPFAEERRVETHQAHTVMGCRVGGLHAPGRFALALLNNILGGPGMNSRLNVTMRERRGLVYAVDSSLTLYEECGLMSIYFGCDAADVPLCCRIARDELARLADKPLSDRTMAAARKQYLGQLALADVGVEQSALSIGRSELRGLSCLTAAERCDAVEAVAAADIRDMAATLLPLSRLTFK